MVKGIMLASMAAVGAFSAMPASAQITPAATPLLVAGGGGGSGFRSNGLNGQSGTAGTAAAGLAGGAGGISGNGGGAGAASIGNAGGGGGLLSSGGTAASLSATGGSSSPFFSGGAGTGDNAGAGGFGGGGGGAAVGSDHFNGGGGGGYSGGGGAGDRSFGGGGGAGSYLDSALLTAIGTLPPINIIGSTTASAPAANGFITISFLGSNPFSQTFNFTGAVQNYTFVTTGQYSILAAGAQGGNSGGAPGGFGALIGGTGTFAANSTLSLIVGGGGANGLGAGGGGGSFVFQTFAAPIAGAVPELATWAMMIVGMAAVGGSMRRHRSVAARIADAV